MIKFIEFEATLLSGDKATATINPVRIDHVTKVERPNCTELWLYFFKETIIISCGEVRHYGYNFCYIVDKKTMAMLIARLHNNSVNKKIK